MYSREHRVTENEVGQTYKRNKKEFVKRKGECVELMDGLHGLSGRPSACGELTVSRGKLEPIGDWLHTDKLLGESNHIPLTSVTISRPNFNFV
jgi:hypothetical protein